MTDEDIEKAAEKAIRTDHCEYNSFVKGAEWAREEAAKHLEELASPELIDPFSQRLLRKMAKEIRVPCVDVEKRMKRK